MRNVTQVPMPAPTAPNGGIKARLRARFITAASRLTTTIGLTMPCTRSVTPLKPSRGAHVVADGQQRQDRRGVAVALAEHRHGGRLGEGRGRHEHGKLATATHSDVRQ
jgi:hypothetical protein